MTFLIDKVFPGYQQSFRNEITLSKAAIIAIFGAGIPEEGIKLFFLLVTLTLFRRLIKSPREQMIPAVGVAIGFGLWESVIYVTSSAVLVMYRDNFASLVIARLITVPIHGYFGFLMGIFLIRRRLGLAWLVPAMAHAVWDLGAVFLFFSNNVEARQALTTWQIYLFVMGCCGFFFILEQWQALKHGLVSSNPKPPPQILKAILLLLCLTDVLTPVVFFQPGKPIMLMTIAMSVFWMIMFWQIYQGKNWARRSFIFVVILFSLLIPTSFTYLTTPQKIHTLTELPVNLTLVAWLFTQNAKAYFLPKPEPVKASA